MEKPIVMTRSGCLDVDIEELGIGSYVPPCDVDAWVEEMYSLLKGDIMPTKDSFLQARERFGPVNFAAQLGKFLSSF